MLFSTFAAAALPLLAMATPIKRAGGPAYSAIPENCTLINPLPHASEYPGNGTINGWKPSDALMNSTVYSFYLEQPDFETINARWEGCLEQCHGLGPVAGTTCKSAFLGFSIATPKGYYGTAGGVPSVACLMFGRDLTPYDFVAAPNGTYLNVTAANIYC